MKGRVQCLRLKRFPRQRDSNLGPPDQQARAKLSELSSLLMPFVKDLLRALVHIKQPC